MMSTRTRIINNQVVYFFYVLVAGQILSLFWTGFGVFVTLLDNHTGKDISTTLAAGVYFVLTVTCGPYMALQRNFVAKIKANWWKFIILGVSDVQGVYLQNLSLKYTTVTSNTVIVNGANVVWVVILSVFLVKTRYKLVHYIAMLISTVGMVVLIIEDLKSKSDNNSGGDNHLLGDVLCILAALAISISLVGEEFLIKGKIGIIDYMAMLGFSGALIASIQLYFLDRKSLVEINWDLRTVLYFLGYNVCNIGYYFLLPPVLIFSSSMVINLSTLTSNVYSLLFAIFLFGNKFSVFYIGGFVVIMFGLILYNIISVPEGGTDQSVFSISYWYNYGHSLFCEWRCCPTHDKIDDIHNDDFSERKSLIGISS
ncbi:solute carrier family 35 member F2-like isoform X1 [Dysidea avara]|uniref:solute carrier family 35 member F2-like isoform X1 n=1 Tax=Dysidea avara TaxID=196820 RepID=UPI0033234C53